MTDSLSDSEYLGGFVPRKFNLKSRAEIEGPAEYNVTVYISKGDESVADFTKYGVNRMEANKVLATLLHSNI